MFFSQFTTHYTANVGRMPAAEAAAIRREALARVTERQKSGRADGALLFDDLIERIECSIIGRR